ncbi:MAG: hypothetical protein R3E32_15300 [Chitinophagales bacterium]
MFQQRETTAVVSTPKSNTNSPKLIKSNSKSLPSSKAADGNTTSISIGNAVEQRSSNEYNQIPPSIDQRTLHPLYELFEETDVASQFYDLDNQRDNTLVTNGSALISIPANCFVHPDGSSVIGNIIIEVKELDSKSEYLLSNITTNTFNSLLSSDGLIYFNAYSHEEILKIAPEKLVYVELPTRNRDGDNRAFFAEFDQKGQSWWTKSMPQINRMISLPLQQMTFSDMDLSPSLKQYLSQAKFEQTFIATRAFEERLEVLQKYQELYAIEEVIQKYTNNIEADLKESDSKTTYYFSQLAKDPSVNPESIQIFQKLANQFSHFAAEKYTKPLYQTPYGINLEDENAYNQLLANGMTAFTANMYMQMNNCRKYLIAERSKEKVANVGRSQAKNTFMIHHTGWFSVNEFLPTNTSKRKMMAQLSSHKDNKANLYLILDGYNTVVVATKDSEGNYLFENLPFGANGSIVAISYKHNQPYIDIQSIVVGEKYLHSLQMRPTTIEMMQYEISQLDYDTHLSASL